MTCHFKMTCQCLGFVKETTLALSIFYFKRVRSRRKGHFFLSLSLHFLLSSLRDLNRSFYRRDMRYKQFIVDRVENVKTGTARFTPYLCITT